MERGATRRQLAQAAIAAGGSVLGVPGVATAAVAPGETDASALTRAFRIERLVELAYQSVLATSVLRPTVRSQLHAILSQELEHISWLERALRGLGAPVPAVSVATARRELTAHHIHLSLAQIPSQRIALKLLIDVESLAEGAYFSAISKISEPTLLRACAEVMACEAQHWTVLSSIQHPGKIGRSVPYPFVQGSP